MIILWGLIFIVSMTVLVKGSDLFLRGAERIGVNFGFSPFLIGVLIVGVGTSLPELTSAIMGVIKGVPDIVVANAVGSNVANIFLVLGVIAIVGKKINTSNGLIKNDLLFFVLSTILFLIIVSDRVVYPQEALVLFLVYLVYMFYLIYNSKKEAIDVVIKSEVAEIKKMILGKSGRFYRFIYVIKSNIDYIFFVLGISMVLGGAKYLIDSVVMISKILNASPEVISITAISLGTSLPELFVSTRAVLTGKTELAIGNILGSNIFNILIVVGVPGLFAILPVDTKTATVGIFALILATVFLIFGFIKKSIGRTYGLILVSLYVLFILKLFNIV